MRSHTDDECKCQGDRSLGGKSTLKRRKFTGQDPANEQVLKKQRLTLRADDNMRWMQHEIAGMKESLEEMAAEIREDRRNLHSTFEELGIADVKKSIEEIAFDIVDIKESIEEMASEAREEKENLKSLLEEFLSEIRQSE